MIKSTIIRTDILKTVICDYCYYWKLILISIYTQHLLAIYLYIFYYYDYTYK